MGWFWKDTECTILTIDSSNSFPCNDDEPSPSPPPGCPMHQASASAMTPTAPVAAPAQSSCPYTQANQDGDNFQPKPKASRYSKYNPLNYMFTDLSQEKAEDQEYDLPTERERSTIPKGTGEGTWEYPSPQQMYNALLRKGYDDTDVTAVEIMVSIHNFLNEGAWGEIVEWERRFGRGLGRGWQISKGGEENATTTRFDDDEIAHPKLVRFQGRPKDRTPKATMLQVLGWIYPGGFKTDSPFDRHDWYVARESDGQSKVVRYVIDYYEGPDEPTGEPVFYLDVRPAVTPTAAVERFMRWGGDVWWRASGGSVREGKRQGESD